MGRVAPKYLSHGFVRLVEHHGSDLSIVNAARVSYGDSSKGPEKDERLLRYLLANKHTSPFEHVVFTFHVKCPIFIARQWMRHRTGSYSEISYRYTEPKMEFFIPDIWRQQGDGNKQMSGGTFNPLDGAEFDVLYMTSIERAVDIYRNFVGSGMARELARAVLPVSLYTEFYFTMDLHNLMHFLGLRLHEHAQPEIRRYAEDIVYAITPVIPTTLKIWKELNGI